MVAVPMASTSVKRDQNEAEIRRLHGEGFSQRQIASHLGVTRPLVQRVLAKPGPPQPEAGDDVEQLRLEIRRELGHLRDAGGYYVNAAEVDRLYELECFANDDYGLADADRLRGAWIAYNMLHA
jgi:predicted transcriptional regulator